MPISDEVAILNSETRRLFASVPHPGPDGIYDQHDTSGNDCCIDHNAWIEWCGKHTYEEFLSTIRKGAFDPFEFLSLSPAAYHYFTPAVILYCLTTLTNPLDDPLEWIEAFIPLPENEDVFRAKYLSRFTAAQRTIVTRVLQLNAEAHVRHEGIINDSVSVAAKIWGARS